MLKRPQGREQLLERIGLWACVVATLLAVCLHVLYLLHAGALWRDEAAGVQLATLPGLGVKLGLGHEWFPIFFFELVRGWSALGLGASDFTLRILGFVVGLCLLGALWFNARQMGCRWPFISLGLLAANLTVVQWGDSLRAYGCGSLFIGLTLALMWRLARAPGRRSFILASTAAVLSVQTLYHSACLVLAACLAGWAVCARRRQWKTAVLVLGVGLLAAASLLPYVPLLVRSQEYIAFSKLGFQLDQVWATFVSALGSDLDWPLWGWLGLATLVLGAGWAALRQRDQGFEIGLQDLPLFAAAAFVAGVALFFVFVRLSEFPAHPWYFLPLMVFAATAMEAALSHWCREFRAWPPLFIALMVCVPFPAMLKLVQCRQTNIDLIAVELQREARPDDLILVHPFFLGISFDRYYKGTVEWTTLPPLEDHRFHRFDLLREGLCSKPLLKGVLDRVARTLASGHTLWMVGGWPQVPPGEPAPPELPDPPPPGQPLSRADRSLCFDAWQFQTVYFVALHAKQAPAIPVQSAIPVSDFERVQLFKVTGWRGERGTPGSP
jgi:hypothetical protein